MWIWEHNRLRHKKFQPHILVEGECRKPVFTANGRKYKSCYSYSTIKFLVNHRIVSTLGRSVIVTAKRSACSSCDITWFEKRITHPSHNGQQYKLLIHMLQLSERADLDLQGIYMVPYLTLRFQAKLRGAYGFGYTSLISTYPSQNLTVAMRMSWRMYDRTITSSSYSDENCTGIILWNTSRHQSNTLRAGSINFYLVQLCTTWYRCTKSFTAVSSNSWEFFWPHVKGTVTYVNLVRTYTLFSCMELSENWDVRLGVSNSILKQMMSITSLVSCSLAT